MTRQDSTARSLARALPLALVLGALAFTPAVAGRDHHRHHKQGRHDAPHARVHHGPPSRHFQRRSHGPRKFRVPQVIHAQHRKSYRRYYHGRQYFRSHRHNHAVYYFPARYRGGYVWKPHSYCDGKLYRGHVAYRGPQLSVRLDF